MTLSRINRTRQGRLRPALGRWLVLAGLLIMLWPAAEWAYGQYAQAQLESEFAANAPPSPPLTPAPIPEPEPKPEGYGEETPVLEGKSADTLVLWTGKAPPPGAEWPATVTVDRSGGVPPMRLQIPKIGLDALAVEGVEPDHLRRGPGHYPEAPLPGEAGNAAFSAHRTTYGAWFRRVDELQEGDTVQVVYPDMTVTYTVQEVFVISPRDWWVVGQTDYPAITLVTCHPAGSSKERLVVRGWLSAIVPHESAAQR